MTNIVEFDKGPMTIGEKRRLVLAGDAPFTVSTSCFVENPPPPGFRPCAECSTTTLAEGEAMDIEVAATFWRSKTGRIQITIKDAAGERLELQLQVLPDTEAAPRAMAT